MVKLQSVKQSNAAFAADRSKSSGLVCVFAGATSGIGASTLQAMVSTLHDSTFYVLGRSSQRFAAQRETLQALNPSCQLNFVECDVSLLADNDVACKQITTEKVDYLYMSQGLVPLNGADYNREGIDTCFALSYYSRVRLLTNLLPLLRKSSRPRVLSVLNGGMEKAILKEDIGLENEANWSMAAAINHTTVMMTLALDFLAKDSSNQNVTLMHAFPGLVRTDIFAKLKAPPSSSFLWSLAVVCIRNIVSFLMMVRGISPEDCGERQVFHLTSDAFAPGSVRLINESSEEAAPSAVLQGYRDEGMAAKVWEYTMRVFDKVFG